MSNSMKTAQISQERDLHTHAELWHASKCVLNKGLEDERGAVWQFLSSILLTAFAFEAFLNHHGVKLIASWMTKEERLPPLKKYTALLQTLGVTPPPNGSPPMSTVKDLFVFRNSIAHGKTVKLIAAASMMAADEVDAFLMTNRPLAPWEKLCQNKDFAIQARHDTEAALKLVHDALPEPKGLLFGFGFSIGSAQAI